MSKAREFWLNEAAWAPKGRLIAYEEEHSWFNQPSIPVLELTPEVRKRLEMHGELVAMIRAYRNAEASDLDADELLAKAEMAGLK